MKKEINLLLQMPLLELVSLANKARQKYIGSNLELCNIMNAKSGACSQDCKFCAQSSRHNTQVNTYPLKTKKEMFAAALQAKAIGADRFDIVTSGNSLSKSDLESICAVLRQIRDKIGIKLCASLGELGDKEFKLLKKSGLGRYHHNIETSPRYFSKIVKAHTFEDRVRTIKAAKAAGLEVCSGGIIGMGEGIEDRVDMALILKKLNVDSVPLNVLVPIKGTPLAGQKPITAQEVIRTIAIFRIILKDKIIKIAAGRESILKDFQALAFMAGASGMLIGGYLTIKGRDAESDRKLVSEVKELWKN